MLTFVENAELDKLWMKIEDFLPKLLGAAVVLLLGLILIKILMVFIRRALAKTRLDPAAHTFIANTVRVTLLVVLGVAVLQQLGVATTSVIAILSAAAAAVVVALKDSLGNVAGGFLILVNKPFKRGDEISIVTGGTQAATGLVDDIDLMVTRLHTWDRQVVTVPNGIVNTSVVNNFTAAGLRRVDFSLLVHYDADLDRVREVLLKTAEETPYMAAEPEPRVIVRDCAESGVKVELWAFTTSDAYWDYKFDLIERVKKNFDAAGIEFPYPQLDVHQK